MTNHLNNALPIEILKNIFQFLSKMWCGKMTIKGCLFVCKSWHVAAREFFGKISITVDERSLEKLSRDIVYFAQNVKCIELMESELEAVDRTVTSLVWLDIIVACPNLIAVKINVNGDSDYIRRLLDTTTEILNHIRYFETSPFTYDHLKLNLKYRKTITTLAISSLEHYSGKDNDDDKLVYFISLFPKLTSFKIDCRSEYYEHFLPSDVDIIQLLEAAPQLQNFDAFQFHEIKSRSITTRSENLLCLDSLTLVVNKIDLDSLLFIVTRFKQLNYLDLDIGELIINVPPEEFSAEELINDLDKFTLGIPKFRIFCRYQYVCYILMNGAKPYSEKIYYYDEDNDFNFFYDDDYDDNYDDNYSD